jgi:hypothetical protein
VIGVTGPEDPDEAALPLERQRARVRLRSGTALEGELRWISPDGERRTADYVNASGAYFVLHAAEPLTRLYVAKAQVATVEEL